MINSLQFWTLVAGLLAFVLTTLFAIPVSPEQVLMVTLFLLGLLGIYPKLRARLLRAPDIFKSMEFWVMVAGLVGFVVSFYFPQFPLDTAAILAIFVFLLRLIGVDPQVLQQAALIAVKAAEQTYAYIDDASEDKKKYAMGAASALLAAVGSRVSDAALSATIEYMATTSSTTR